MLKSNNQATLFVNYSYNSFFDFRSSKNTHSEQKVMCQNMGFFIWWTFNRYPREWSSYFYTLLMVTNEFHWCLLKSLQTINNYSLIGKCIAT